jgi:hypothetical protein
MKWLKRWKTQTLLPLAVIGPGFITANVDKDASGILAHSFVRIQSGRIPFWNIFGLVNCFGISDCFCPEIFSETCVP